MAMPPPQRMVFLSLCCQACTFASKALSLAINRIRIRDSNQVPPSLNFHSAMVPMFSILKI